MTRFRLVGFVLLLCSMGSAVALDRDLARFAAAKQAQVREYSQSIGNKVPSVVWSLFDAVRVDDWETATNLAARLEKASGRYSESITNHDLSPALHTPIWPPISEMIGAYDQFHNWDSKCLQRFGRAILDSVPRGSIYFGGTDPGRFIISALCESQPEGKPFFTLTQNQLADQNYLEYLRRMYGKQLKIPTQEEAESAFKEYASDAERRFKKGLLKAGEEVHFANNHVQVSGQIAVMTINGLLAKIILKRNPGHEVYLEESFALDWMYPYLSPHGAILQLHSTPLDSLEPAIVEKDMVYWKNLTGELIGDWINERTSVKEICDFADRIYLAKNLEGFKGESGFARNDDAQKCFSKLRSSIAGVYLWRAEHSRDAGERADAQRAADLALRQAFALCPCSPEAVYRYSKFLTERNRPDDAFLIAKTALRLAPDDGYLQDLTHSLSKAE